MLYDIELPNLVCGYMFGRDMSMNASGNPSFSVYIHFEVTE